MSARARVKRALWVSLALIVVVLCYGVAIEPRLILAVDYETAALPHLPSSWDGQRVAVISDVQVGMWLGNDDMARRAVHQIVAAHPAAVFLLGDFVDQPTGDLRDNLRTVVQLVHPLIAARLPTYAVLGNHDYGMDTVDARRNLQTAAQVGRVLEANGVRVLQNSAVVLPTPGRPTGPAPGEHSVSAPLYVVGIGPHWGHMDDPARALAGVPHDAARVVIMHDPASFPLLPPASAPLSVAGHTHCGQVRIPFLPHWSWLSAGGGRQAPVGGWIERYGNLGNRLYINCGIGLGVVPMRIADPPQITLFTLRRAASS